MQEEITHFSQKGTVAISGDFNARTGRLPDFTLFIDPDNHNILTSFQQYNIYNFSQHNRHSDDIKFNRYGKDLLELCKSSNMRIMNGYYNNDATTGTFTCYTANDRSLIDYLICDSKFCQALSSFRVDPLVSDSDHRPLIFSINLKTRNTHNYFKRLNANQTEQVANEKFGRYIFNIETARGLNQTLVSDQCVSLYDSFINCVITDMGVDEAVKGLYVLLDTALSDNFSKKYMKSIRNNFPQNKWFDKECKTLKHALNGFSKNNELNSKAILCKNPKKEKRGSK